MQVKKHRIFLVDDHPILRQGLALLMDQEPDLMVCGVASDARAALAAIPKARPDIVVTDLSMPGPDGLELIKHLRVLMPKLPILVLSMHDEKVYAERVLKAGAHGYIMKHELESKVMKAIRRILHGELYVSPSVAGRLVNKFSESDTVEHDTPDTFLGDRELQIFILLGRGRLTAEIAAELGIGVKTVETHMGRIRQKLGFSNSNEMISQATLWVQQQQI